MDWGLGRGEIFSCILSHSKVMLSMDLYTRCQLAQPETHPPLPPNLVIQHTKLRLQEESTGGLSKAMTALKGRMLNS